MNENVVTVKGRQVQKHDIEVNWIKAGNATNPFIPLKGEIIIYDSEVDNEGNILELPEGREIAYDYARMKIGDGIHNINELPFSSKRLFEEGAANNSVLQVINPDKDEVEAGVDVTNHALSPAAVALGKSNYAGSLGYMIEPTSLYTSGSFDTFYINDYNDDLAVGDTLTLKIGNSFDEWAQITDLQSNVIFNKEIYADAPATTATVNISEYGGEITSERIFGEFYTTEQATFYLEDTSDISTPYKINSYNGQEYVQFDETNHVTLPGYDGPYELYISPLDPSTPITKGTIKIRVLKVNAVEEIQTALITINKPITLNKSNIVTGRSGNGTIRCSAKPYIGNVEIDTCQFAAGEGNVAAGWAATALGGENNSVGRYSFTAGAVNTAVYGATALCFENKSLGHYSFTANRQNIASGEGATAFGKNTEASAMWSASFGQETKAKGNRSITSGYKTEATGNDSQAHGGYSKATALRATAHGYNLNASHENEFVTGKYNDTSLDTFFSVGDGVERERHNALSVLKTGDVLLGQYPSKTMHAANKGYVDNKFDQIDFSPYAKKADIPNIADGITTKKITAGVSAGSGANLVPMSVVNYSMGLGQGCSTTRYGSIAAGYQVACNSTSSAFGTYLKTNNSGEVALGTYNLSTSGETLFSVGNGTWRESKNAIEVKKDGSVLLQKDATTANEAVRYGQLNGYALKSNVDRNEAKLFDHEKRLFNIEKGLAPDFIITDDTVAYEKDIPENVCSVAQLNYIGGRTIKGFVPDGEPFITEKAGANIGDGEYWETDYNYNINYDILIFEPGAYFVELSDGYAIEFRPDGQGSIIPSEDGIVELPAYNEYMMFRITNLEPMDQEDFHCFITIYKAKAVLQSAKTSALKLNKANGDSVIKEIPETILSLEGYGEGNLDNPNEYNYIEFENQQFVQVGRAGEVGYSENLIDDFYTVIADENGDIYSTLVTISLDAGTYIFKYEVPDDNIDVSLVVDGRYMYDNKFTITKKTTISIDTRGLLSAYGTYNISTDLRKELPTWIPNSKPVITPITFDKLIDIEDVISIEFVNDKKIMVPSSITYMLK